MYRLFTEYYLKKSQVILREAQRAAELVSLDGERAWLRNKESSKRQISLLHHTDERIFES